MHLQVTFLSELTNTACNRLSPSTFGENKRYRKRSNLQWSKQHNPDKQTWSVWKKMITTIYCGAKDSLFLRPTMRLGQWKCNHFQHTQIHPYLYSPSTMEIYQQKPQQTTQWFASTNNQEEIQIMLDSSTSCSTIPSDSYPHRKENKKKLSTLSQSRSHSMQKENNSIMERIYSTTRWLDKNPHPNS